VSRPPARTDRGMWRVVAARDFWVRLRDKGFVISTAITVTVLTVFILVRAYAGGVDTFDLGVVGDRAVAEAAAALGERAGIEVAVTPLPDDEEADRALRDGRVDAVLVGDREDVLAGTATLLVLRDTSDILDQVVQASAIAARIDAALDEAGVGDETIRDLQDQHPVDRSALLPADPDRDSKAAVALAAILVLYGQLFGYGVWIATGVIEEKSSRVVEVLLSTIRARQLMAGKILGIGTLGLIQLILIGVYAVILANGTGAIEVPGESASAAALAVGWFVLGFGFYAALFAVAGALVSRMEELQNAIVPINLVVFASFFVAIGAIEDPRSTLAIVASLVPFSSSLTMPVRMVMGAATPVQIAASLVILVGTTAVLVPLAGRVYAGAILRIGAKVRIRDAWRAAA
jgi:ABC-2 type transport system permease protein